MMPRTSTDIGMSRWERGRFTSTLLLLKISVMAFFTTPLTTFDMLIRPMMPAIASMPMPMWRM